MPDGVIFTKSQALQLFYQTGEIPAPINSGDAINLDYFQNNVNVTGDIQVASAIVGYSGDPVGYLGFWGGTGDDLYYMALGPSGNLYFGQNPVTDDATVNPLLAAGLGAILEDGSTYFDAAAYAEHASTYAIKSRKNLIADITDLNDDFDDADINTTFWQIHDNTKAGWVISEAGTKLDMLTAGDHDFDSPVYHGHIVASQYKLAGDFQVIVKFGGVSVTSWDFGDYSNLKFGMHPYVANIATAAQDPDLNSLANEVASLTFTNNFFGLSLYHYYNYGGTQPHWGSSVDGVDYGVGDGSQPDSQYVADGVQYRFTRSTGQCTVEVKFVGDSNWTTLINGVTCFTDDAMLVFNVTNNDVSCSWFIDSVTWVSGSASYASASGPYASICGYGAELGDGEDALRVFDQPDDEGDPIFRVKAGGDVEISGDLTVRGDLTVMSGETIYAGVSGETAGKMELLPGAADYPGRLVFHPASGAKQFLSIDDSGYIRLGETDPAGDPDVNPLLSTALGALQIDGSNYMQSSIGFSAMPAKLESRQNLVDSYASVNDDFDDGDLSTALWTLDPTSHEKYTVIESGSNVQGSCDGSNVASDPHPRIAGISSKFTIDGDFDIRCQSQINTGAGRYFYMVLAPTDWTLEDISTVMFSESGVPNGDGPLCVMHHQKSGSTAYFSASVDNGTSRDFDQTGSSGTVTRPMRLYRSGSAVSSSTANTWADRESSWTVDNSKDVINKAWNTDPVRVWFIWEQEFTFSGIIAYLHHFEVTAGEVALEEGAGPLVQLGGAGAALPGSGEEHALEVYAGPIGTGEPVFAVRDDGVLSGEDMYLNAIPGLVSENLGGGAASGDVSHPWEPNGLLHPAGHSHSQTEVSWSGDQFTISPVDGLSEFSYFVSGEEYTSTGETLSVGTGEGVHWIYFGEGGVLESQLFGSVDFEKAISQYCLVGEYYWSEDSGEAIFIGDERHGMQMDGATHRYLHNTFGCRYIDGLAISGYTIDEQDSDDSVRFGLAEGTIADEDIFVDVEELAHPASIKIFYRWGASAWRAKKDEWPYIQPGVADYPAGTYPAYNDENGGDWTLVDVGNGDYFNVWVFASTGLEDQVFGVVSQVATNTLGQAEDEEFADLNLTGLPVAEVKVLYKLTYHCRGSASNTHQLRLREVVDFRSQQFEGTSYQPVSHASLAGRFDPNQHPEGAIELTGDYDGHLAGQTSLYGALQALDDLSTGTTTQITGEANVEVTGDYSGTPLSGVDDFYEVLAVLKQRATRQIGWYMDGNDVTGDLLAIQPLHYQEGPYELVSANIDYRVPTSGEAEWDIQYCASGDFGASGEPWTSIFTVKPTIDSGEYTSESAATSYVFSGDLTLAEGARLRAINTLPSGEDATITLVVRGTT